MWSKSGQSFANHIFCKGSAAGTHWSSTAKGTRWWHRAPATWHHPALCHHWALWHHSTALWHHSAALWHHWHHSTLWHHHWLLALLAESEVNRHLGRSTVYHFSRIVNNVDILCSLILRWWIWITAEEFGVSLAICLCVCLSFSLNFRWRT